MPVTKEQWCRLLSPRQPALISYCCSMVHLWHGSFVLQELVAVGSNSMAMVPLLMLTLPAQAQAVLDGRSKASRGHVSDTHTPLQMLKTHKDRQQQLRLLRRSAWVLQVACCSASKISMRVLSVCTCLSKSTSLSVFASLSCVCAFCCVLCIT